MSSCLHIHFYPAFKIMFISSAHYLLVQFIPNISSSLWNTGFLSSYRIESSLACIHDFTFPLSSEDAALLTFSEPPTVIMILVFQFCLKISTCWVTVCTPNICLSLYCTVNWSSCDLTSAYKYTMYGNEAHRYLIYIRIIVFTNSS